MILGIEIGGTKLQLGVGTKESLDFTDLIRLDVDRNQGADGILKQIARHAPALIEKHSVQRIGVGFGGPVDVVNRRVITSHHVAGWEGLPIGDWCNSEFGLSTDIDNDCNVAALAEAIFGAGRGHKRVFYVTVGTGIGGGFVMDGCIYGNDRPGVAEIGHLRPGTTAKDERQTVESISSGSGLENQTRRRIQELHTDESKHAIAELFNACDGDLAHLSAKAITAAALSGNELAAATFQDAVETLGWAIAQMATLLAPDVVVVGGGVSLVGEVFFERLQQAVDTYSFAPLKREFEILPAELVENVVVNGAILIASN